MISHADNCQDNKYMANQFWLEMGRYHISNKKAVLSQRWPRDAPYIYGCPENFWESLATPTATFLEIVNVAIDRMYRYVRTSTKFEVRSFICQLLR